MADANAMKVARDGHLWYGEPNSAMLRIQHCEATGHRGVIEYGDIYFVVRGPAAPSTEEPRNG